MKSTQLSPGIAPATVPHTKGASSAKTETDAIPAPTAAPVHTITANDLARAGVMLFSTCAVVDQIRYGITGEKGAWFCVATDQEFGMDGIVRVERVVRLHDEPFADDTDAWFWLCGWVRGVLIPPAPGYLTLERSKQLTEIEEDGRSAGHDWWIKHPTDFDRTPWTVSEEKEVRRAVPS